MINKSKKKNSNNNKKDRFMVARVASGFRAGYHHIKDNCGIKQKLTF